MTVSFQNPGEIDLKAAMTFGVSAKVSTNPIGYFGTGLKYALAVILRNGGKVTISVGLKSYTFTTAEQESRGTSYSEVLMSGRPLHFATNLGRNWVAWQAFRELYCNVKDEGGDATNRPLKPREGYTTITVKGWPDFDLAYEKRSEFFLEGRTPIAKTAMAEIFEGASSGVYYRGILVATLEKPSVFTYNITTRVELTEDRTLKYQHSIPHMIGCTMLKPTDAAVLKAQALAEPGTFEAAIALDAIGYDPSDLFLDTVSELRRGPEGGRVSRNVIDVFTKARPVDDGTEVVALNEEQKKMLADALDVLAKTWPSIRTMPIIPVASLGAGIYGLARSGKCYISQRCFASGFDYVVGTLMEEFFHISMNFRDESRDFQNYLINLLARSLQGKNL